MDIRKFGAYVSKLRKEHDLTQSQLAEQLNVTRQAVSKWEQGDSFPDVALLTRLAEQFCVTVDQLLNYGETAKDESKIMLELAQGHPENVAQMLQRNELPVESVINVAPIVKASTLDTIAEGFGKHGIDIKHIVELAVYMNDTGLTNLIKKASLDNLDERMLERFIPFLDEESKNMIFAKIIDQELNSTLLTVMLPYIDLYKYGPLIEAAIIEGQLESDFLKLLQKEAGK